MLRWLTAGESHGPALVAILEGLPAGVALTSDDIRAALARRRLGYGRGARQKFEQDEVRVLGGLRHGQTLGGPLAVEIGNSEWPKWSNVMAPDPVAPEALLVDAGTGDEREVARNRPLTRPRPGHADLAGLIKYGFDDARPILERASARETAARVALGEAARQFLRQAAGIEIFSHVVGIGEVEVPDNAPSPTAADVARIDADPMRCADPATSARMVAEVDAAKADSDTIGGVVEIIAEGLPVGLGSHVHGDRRLDARLAGALMSIPAVKGVEVGDGFRTARRRGSMAHDEINPKGDLVNQPSEIVPPTSSCAEGAEGDRPPTSSCAEGAEGDRSRRIVQRSPQTGQTERACSVPVRRLTNRAGGIEGGISNGEAIRLRIAMKPISTVPRALRTIDLETGGAATANHQRSDTCAVPAAGIVAEAMVALVLADAFAEKYGGDSLAETKRHLAASDSSVIQTNDLF